MPRVGDGRRGTWAQHGWDWLGTLASVGAELVGVERPQPAHTTVTVRAVVDAVLPETPGLATDRGAEHEPGGVAAGVGDALVTYLDGAFQFGLPRVGPRGNLPLARLVATLLDTAALVLLGRDDTADVCDERARALVDADDQLSRPAEAAGPFAKLSRRDRLRAIGILDEYRPAVVPTGDGRLPFDAGLVGQLVVGFTEFLYYSEWQGYDDYQRPPGDRENANDPTANQGWGQTGYPGVAEGYAALRGYLGSDDGPLGDGATWAPLDDGSSAVRLTRRPGTFRENDYDTTGYEEPHPE